MTWLFCLAASLYPDGEALIACDIGLDAMRNACPHFDAWLQQLDALV